MLWIGVQPGEAAPKSARAQDASRTGRSDAWHRPPTAAEALKFNAKRYHVPIGSELVTTAKGQLEQSTGFA